MTNNNRLINDFINMAKISSPSKNERNIANYIKDELSKMNIEFYEDNANEKINSNTGNIIAHIKGDINKKVLLSAHMDTVTPCDVINVILDEKNQIIKTDETSILGADDKAGIASILEAIKVIKEKNISHCDIILVFTVCEEIGLVGASHVDLSKFGKIDHGYVLDAGGSPGICYNQSPFSVTAKFKVIGKEAHAGMEPEKGINAFVVSSDAVSKLHIGRLDFETTCNIGIVNGGVATNVVMPSLELDFEARSLNEDKLNNLVSNVITTFEASCDKYDAKFIYDIKKGTPGFYLSEENDTIKILKNSANNLDLKFSAVPSGGGSDTNIYNILGIDSVNIGIGMSNVHTKEEYIKISDLINSSRLLVEVIQNVK